MLISAVSRCVLTAKRINRNTGLGETARTQQTLGVNHAAAYRVSLQASSAAQEQSRTWEEETCSLTVPLPATNWFSFSTFSNQFLVSSASNVHTRACSFHMLQTDSRAKICSSIHTK